MFRVANELFNKNNKSNIQWARLGIFCDNNSSNGSKSLAKSLEKRLAKVALDFNRVKVKLSPDERRSLRQHFLRLAEECTKLGDFKSADIIMKTLADSAYKLPDGKC